MLAVLFEAPPNKPPGAGAAVPVAGVDAAGFAPKRPPGAPAVEGVVLDPNKPPPLDVVAGVDEAAAPLKRPPPPAPLDPVAPPAEPNENLGVLPPLAPPKIPPAAGADEVALLDWPAEELGVPKLNDMMCCRGFATIRSQ